MAMALAVRSDRPLPEGASRAEWERTHERLLDTLCPKCKAVSYELWPMAIRETYPDERRELQGCVYQTLEANCPDHPDFLRDT
jgi:hypothetical protein